MAIQASELTPNTNWSLNTHDLQLIDMALNEDLGTPFLDLTTEMLFYDRHNIGQAHIISKHPHDIILCGLPVIRAILAKFDSRCELQSAFEDGASIAPGATVLTLTGPVSILLMTERIMLNFLQHLCAIATLTAKYKQAIKQTKAQILDTRKTRPGFRHLDKYAVQCGGGINHRMGLYDAIMIKDTHIDALGGIEKAILLLPQNITQRYPVIVEVRSKLELALAIKYGIADEVQPKISRILLDNMSPALLAECVAMCNGAIPTEASGNVDLDSVLAIAESGVDFISIGKITHSAGNVDLSMKCER